MANGQQLSDENFQKFVQWMSEKTDNDYRQLERRGVLNRTDIADECDFSTNVLRQNPRVRQALKELEDVLRSRGVLPPIAEKAAVETLQLFREPGQRKATMANERLRRLEQDNAALRYENEELKRQLQRFTTLQQALAMTGRLPR